MTNTATPAKIFQVYKNDKSFRVTNEQGLFWERINAGDWEPHTFTVLDTFLDERHAFIDIGAWIGPTALYGCLTARHCYALEPDPEAFRQLRENFELNPGLLAKATLSNLCIADRCGTVRLGNITSDAGGDSMSSLLFGEGPTGWDVPAVTLAQFVRDHGINDCNFIKMDVEGAETLILPDIADLLHRLRPTLYLSLHPKFLDNPLPAMKAVAEVLEIYRYIYTDGWRRIDSRFLLETCNLGGCYEVVCTDVEVGTDGGVILAG